MLVFGIHVLFLVFFSLSYSKLDSLFKLFASKCATHSIGASLEPFIRTKCSMDSFFFFVKDCFSTVSSALSLSGLLLSSFFVLPYVLPLPGPTFLGISSASQKIASVPGGTVYGALKMESLKFKLKCL